MSFCDPDVQTLVERNVNNSLAVPIIPDEQNGFVLAQPNLFTTCQDLRDPFQTFCLIPKGTPDELGSNMCALSTQTNHVNSLFERMVSGDFRKLDDMPSIYESSTLPVSPNSAPWLPVVPEIECTLGLFPNPVSMAVGNDCVCLHIAKDGALFENNSDGFLRQSLQNDGETPVTGQNTEFQNVMVSSTGRVRICLFSNAVYLFLNNAWILLPNTDPTLRYQNTLLWEQDTFIYVGIFYTNTSNWHLDIYQFTDTTSNSMPEEPFATVGQSGNTYRLGFVTLNGDNSLIVMTTFLSTNLNVMHVHYVFTNNFANPQYDQWLPATFLFGPIFEATPGGMYTAAYCDFSSPAESILLLSFLFVFHGFPFTLFVQSFVPGGILTVLQPGPHPVRLGESLNHNWRLYLRESQLRTNIAGNVLVVAEQPFSLNDDEKTDGYVFAIAPNGADVWIFRHGQLYRLHNNIVDRTYGNAWTFDFNLYNSRYAIISDFGAPQLDPRVYVPGATWYLGTSVQAIEYPLQERFPAEIFRSAHQTFRYAQLFAQRDFEPLITFPYAVCQMQRANEYGLASTLGAVRLFNDSQVTMGEGLWQTNTHDRASYLDPDNPSLTSRLLDLRESPYAVSSPNGLYIFYVTPEYRMRLVYNMFNNNRFYDWCLQDEQRLARALDIQSNFCWNSLRIPGTGPSDIFFTDNRCTCIGGERLFRIMAPEAENVQKGMYAPLQNNMPCYLAPCNLGASDLFHDTPTNVQRFTEERCLGRKLQVCQANTVFGVDVKLINVQVVRLQNCLINGVKCDENAPCGPGMACFNGKCTAACNNVSQCQQAYGSSVNYRCEEGACVLTAQPQTQTSPWMIAGIILGLVLVMLILLFVGLLAAREADQFNNKKYTKKKKEWEEFFV